MPGIIMCWRRVCCKYDSFPSKYAIIIMSIGHDVACEMETLAIESSCWFAGTNLSWVGLR